MRPFALLLCLIFPPLLLAAPPVIDIPPEVKATSEYVTISPKTDAAAITYVAQSGVEPFPSAFLKDPRSFVLPTRGLAAGRYKFVAIGSLNDEHQRVDFVVVVGDAPPTPPVPPGPGPQPPGPNPPVPPSPAGKRAVLFIWESADSSPAVASLITNLRAGTAAKYFADKGHTLNLLDDDEVNEDGKPSALLEAWKPHFAGMKLPALFVIDPATKALLHKQEIAPTVTADSIVEIVRQHGG